MTTAPVTLACEADCLHGDDIARDRWGRPLVDGDPMTRVSTFSKTLDDSNGLISWKARTVVKGISGSNAEHLREAVLAATNDRELDHIVEEAKILGGGSAASARGTALHAHVATLNRGGSVPEGLSPATIASLDAYRRELDRLKLEPVLAEQFVAAVRWSTAGTFDVALRTPRGDLVMADLKTGAKAWEAKYPMAVTVQNTQYAHGRRYCPKYGWLGELGVDQRVALLISLPVDTGQCFTTRLDLEWGARMSDLAASVREARKEQTDKAVRL